MDYKEQIEQAKHAAVKWREQHPIVGVGELRVDCMVDDLCRSITDLLARAEASEARVRELETSFRTEKCENGPECVELGRVRKALAEAESRAEKAERERDAAIYDLTYIARTYPVDLCDDLVCQYCKHYQNVNTGCPGWTENDCFEWRGKKEE